MEFNIVSKNNIGVVTALLLVILLSQSQFFNFLLDSALGRAILILFILFISYTNKILGVVSVLFIIIMFNSSDIGYTEGFVPNLSSTNSVNKDINSTTPVTATPVTTTATAAPVTATKKSQDTTGGAEGSNLIESDRTIKLGKKSNEISTQKSTNTENIEPFSGIYSSSVGSSY